MPMKKLSVASLMLVNSDIRLSDDQCLTNFSEQKVPFHMVGSRFGSIDFVPLTAVRFMWTN